VILWLALAGALVAIGVACAWMVERNRRSGPPRQHDPDWGDWPSDQLAP
jgi:hypothetical protein